MTEIELLKIKVDHLSRQLKLRESECRYLRAKLRELSPPTPQAEPRHKHTNQFFSRGVES